MKIQENLQLMMEDNKYWKRGKWWYVFVSPRAPAQRDGQVQLAQSSADSH